MIKEIELDVWQTSVVFIVEPTLKEFDMFYYDNTKRLSDADYKQMRRDIASPQTCEGFTFVTDDGGIIVYLREAFRFLYSIHELEHAINKILMMRGVNHDADAEPWAYTIGYLAEEYYKWICTEKDVFAFVPRKFIKEKYLKDL